MTQARPRHILISGGRETGGLTSFAANLAEGFRALDLSVEVIPPTKILSRWRDLRDPRVLKILSTTAVLAVPFARQAVCVAHGTPRAELLRFLGILASFRLVNLTGAPLVAVSAYVALHLQSLFSLRVEAVIHNALAPAFLQPHAHNPTPRNWVSFVGRLHPTKNLHRLLPALIELVETRPELKVCIIGEGPQRSALESMLQGHPRFEFRGQQDAQAIREQLRQSAVFISGCETEALGIAYLEALSQGCNVVMPASGGGLEIAPQWIGSHVQLVPLTFERNAIVSALLRALALQGPVGGLEGFRPEQVACQYLRLYR